MTKKVYFVISQLNNRSTFEVTLYFPTLLMAAVRLACQVDGNVSTCLLSNDSNPTIISSSGYPYKNNVWFKKQRDVCQANKHSLLSSVHLVFRFDTLILIIDIDFMRGWQLTMCTAGL